MIIMVPLDLEGNDQQLQIITAMSSSEILCQLAEECCEAGQAALKVRRVLHGTTPVSMEEAAAKLEEEVGDVMLLFDCAARKGLIDLERSMESARKKNKRWFGRVIGT